MYRMLHASVGWHVATFDASFLDPAATSVSTDWLRYNGNCWLLWSDRTLAAVSDAFKARLQPNDQLMVAAIDRDFLPVGYMPQWIWDWVNVARDADTGYVHRPPQPVPAHNPSGGLGIFGLPPSPRMK